MAAAAAGGGKGIVVVLAVDTIALMSLRFFFELVKVLLAHTHYWPANLFSKQCDILIIAEKHSHYTTTKITLCSVGLFTAEEQRKNQCGKNVVGFFRLKIMVTEQHISAGA